MPATSAGMTSQMLRRLILEPHIPNTSTIPRQVLKAVEPLKMVDDHRCNGLWFREPDVDGDAATALLIGPRTPVSNAPAFSAKMKAEVSAAGIRLGLARYPDPLALIVMGPERPVAAAGRAIACRCSLRNPLECPANCTTKTRTLDHRVSLLP